MLNQGPKLAHWDEWRDIIIPGNTDETLAFCVEHLLQAYHVAIHDHGAFYLVLSGGSTPKAIFEKISSPLIKDKIDWTKVHLFWGDERSVAPDDKDSNYHMAMEAGFKRMPIPSSHIHRMVAETDIDNNASQYEKIIKETLKGKPFDYLMLGMGEDGHTASLFPKTQALSEENKMVCSNWVPQKNTWRMTLTYPCINHAHHIVIYVMGSSKKEMLYKVMCDQPHFVDLPVTRVGTKKHKALWICDQLAAEKISDKLKS
jgi:6-phosphogluconolactonase